MDRLRDFLEDVRERRHAQGNLLGLLTLVIGRSIRLADGALVANGVTWRQLAAMLKKIRWDKKAVRELGLDPAHLPPRDRQRYWYAAITQAGVDSPQAAAAANRFAAKLEGAGYQIGPPPSS